ncbi:hypothetical protein F5884DRAFT_702436, partial [Xylogone sp. PMI_703]
MTVPLRVAVVTGANKGIGFAIVRNLALQYPSSILHAGQFLIYLTARSEERGIEAVNALNSDPQLRTARVLTQDGGETTIKFQKLDICDPDSVYAFRDLLVKEHTEGIDVVINNAGICLDEFTADAVQQSLRTNYYGTVRMSECLLPLTRSGGRLVNVASASGQLNRLPAHLKEAFISSKSVEACTSLAVQFVVDVKAGKVEEWEDATYNFSKAAEIAATKAMALDVERSGKNILINACCPGGVKTDMNPAGGKTPDEGAKTPVLLALGEFGGTTGGFWRSEKIIEW